MKEYFVVYKGIKSLSALSQKNVWKYVGRYTSYIQALQHFEDLKSDGFKSKVGYKFT